jgi:Pectate lyase superfamily protein
MPKSIPTIGDPNWGTPLNAHLSQLQNPTNGGINTFEQFSQRPTNLTVDDGGKTYLYTQTGNIHQWTGTVWKVLNESVINVKDYGAVGDGVTNDSGAVHNAINSTNDGGTIFFPKGVYKFNSPVRLKSYLKFIGVGGYKGSVLLSGNQNIILLVNDGISTNFGLEYVEISHLAFSGINGKAIYMTDLTKYMSTFHIHQCHFTADLEECIYANMLGCDIENNAFGLAGGSYPLAGANQTKFRHIYCKGDLSNYTANINRITNNRFVGAKGVDSACYFSVCYLLHITGNDFEQNETLALRIDGSYSSFIRGCWFEANRNCQYMMEFNDAISVPGFGAIGNYVSMIEECFFGNFAENPIVAICGNSGYTLIHFKYNTGFNSAGLSMDVAKLTQQTTGNLINQNIQECKFNRIIGSNIPTI